MNRHHLTSLSAVTALKGRFDETVGKDESTRRAALAEHIDRALRYEALRRRSFVAVVVFLCTSDS